MLSHWLIVVPKDATADSEVQSRVNAALSRFLYYVPDRALFHRQETGIWCLSVSRTTALWDMEEPYRASEQAFLALAGVPTLEAVAGDGNVVQKVARALDEFGAQWIYENVGGTFSIGSVSKGPDGGVVISAFSDFSGYHSCFYLDTERFFAIGNRASFVAAFQPGFPDHHGVNREALSWPIGTTMIMGTETPFAGVRRLRSGYQLRVSKGASGNVTEPRQSLMRPDLFTPVEGASIDALPLADICERLGRRVRWCSEMNADLRAHLTGGRDTRAIAAILSSQGCADAVARFLTVGTEENGDVIIARRLARELHVEDKHQVLAGNKGSDPISAAELASVLCRSPAVFECQLTAYDGRKQILPRPPMHIMLMGGGGEIYRQEWASSGSFIGPQGAVHALSLFSPHDRLGLLSDAAKEAQLTTMRHELHHLQERGAVNLACAFYLEERLSNWGCSHFSNGPTTQFPLLLDQQLARYMLSIADVAEDVHFDIIRHGGPQLLNIPFLNNKWAAATEARAKALGLAPTPMTVPTERNFPWQFHAYGRFRNALIDFCLECGDALRDWIPPAKLEELRSRPIAPFGSAHIKMLFGLCGAVVFAEQGWHPTRDFDDGTRPRCAGNVVDGIQTSLGGAQVVNNEIFKVLARHLQIANEKKRNPRRGAEQSRATEEQSSQAADHQHGASALSPRSLSVRSQWLFCVASLLSLAAAAYLWWSA